MMQDWLPQPMAKKEPVKLNVTNASPKDQVFLRTLVSFFTDPLNEALVERLRTGRFAIQYNPYNGEAHMVDLELDEPSPDAGELVNFFASFTKEEWDVLKSRHKELKGRFLRSEASARRLVSQILGYEWKPKVRDMNEG